MQSAPILNDCEYMKVVYLNCGKRCENEKKNSGLYGIWTYEPCNKGAALYKLS